MQFRQASGPWGPRGYAAFQYVAEDGYLSKDWDWAASPLTVVFPSLPYLVSSSMGCICELITRGAPPLPRTAPNFGGAPTVNPDADSLLRAASNLVDAPDRAKVHAEIRVPPATPNRRLRRIFPRIRIMSRRRTIRRFISRSGMGAGHVRTGSGRKIATARSEKKTCVYLRNKVAISPFPRRRAL